MAQLIRPSSDITVATWTPTPLFQQIDEVTASDTDFISSSDGTNDTCEIQLSAAEDPGISTGHIVRYRYRKSASSGNSRSIQAFLFQGATQIAAGTVRTPTTTTWTADTFTLTGAQADAITDYSNLRLQFAATGTTGGNPNNRRSVQVSWAEVEIPSATLIDNTVRGLYGKKAGGGGLEVLSIEYKISNDDIVAITYQNTGTENAELVLRDDIFGTNTFVISVPAGTTSTTSNPPAGFKYAAGREYRLGV